MYMNKKGGFYISSSFWGQNASNAILQSRQKMFKCHKFGWLFNFVTFWQEGVHWGALAYGVREDANQSMPHIQRMISSMAAYFYVLNDKYDLCCATIIIVKLVISLSYFHRVHTNSEIQDFSSLSLPLLLFFLFLDILFLELSYG